jgi:hypothetical protein
MSGTCQRMEIEKEGEGRTREEDKEFFVYQG